MRMRRRFQAAKCHECAWLILHWLAVSWLLNGANRRLMSLFFNDWRVRAVSLLCPGLGTVRINHSLKERVTRAQTTSHSDNKLYTYTVQLQRLWKIPFRDLQDN